MVAELGLTARRGRIVGFGRPARGAWPVAVELIVDLVLLETGAQRCRDCPGNPVALVAVVQDVEKGEAGVLVDGGAGRGVDEVPGGPDVGVGDIERFVQFLEGFDWRRRILG